MYKTRLVYPNTQVGKQRALDNLEFAIADKGPWFLSIPQRTPGDVKFSNWVLQDTLEEAKFCIKLASKDIWFYQMDAEEVGEV